jgi:nucleoside-diphosphate-sugar epimerase
LTSTGSVYADPEQLTPIEESDVDLAEIAPDYDANDFAQSYGINKRQAELVLHERDDVSWTVIRPPPSYSVPRIHRSGSIGTFSE